MSTTIQFTDRTNGGEHPIVEWWWDFGDGIAATEQNPQHTYYDDGQYDVCLVVLNDCGSTDKTTQAINITGDNMRTHTEQVQIADSNQITIRIPIQETTIPIQIIDEGLDTPLVGAQVELLDVDETMVFQSQTTDSEGIVFFVDVVHGDYKIRITY